VVAEVELRFSGFIEHSLGAVSAQDPCESRLNLKRRVLMSVFLTVIRLFQLHFQLKNALLKLLVLAYGESEVFLK